MLESRNYDPYGDLFGATGSNQTSYGFTGEPTDSNGLLHLRTRYYNPVAGVFTALDQFEGVVTRPMSLNGYSWVEGNTPNKVDPSGRDGELVIGGVIATEIIFSLPLTLPVLATIGIFAVGAIAAGFALWAIIEGIKTCLADPEAALKALNDKQPSSPGLNHVYDYETAQNVTDLVQTASQAQTASQTQTQVTTNTDVNSTSEDDCLDGLTREQAAQQYADIARYEYFEELQSASGEYPPMVIAVTRAKDPSSDTCRYYVGVNDVLRNPSSAERNAWNRARSQLERLARNNGTTPVFGGNRVNNGSGSFGHAERNLYDGLNARGISVVAIGLTKAPCPNCQDYFQVLPVVFRYSR